jgi:peptide/nickel transport system substrate-binding protein
MNKRRALRRELSTVVMRVFIAALTLGLAQRLFAATSPLYGGTLVVELRSPTLVLDPAKWKTGSPESSDSMQMAAAIFDRLISLDRYGRLQPALATDWSHDAQWRHWQFSVRPGVQFSDGAALNSGDIADALRELLPGKPAITATATHVVLQFPVGVFDLPEQLASGRYFIFRRNANGTLAGTGAFFVGKSSSATSGGTFKLLANERCWAGRPFVDAIDVLLGVPALRQLFDLQLGKTDVVDLSPELAHRAARDNLRVWSSAPVYLYALQMAGNATGGKADARRPTTARLSLGETLSQALDRATMANVLLQKQAEPAASFLPQWLSGYAFVFGTERNVGRAQETSARSSGAAASPQPLRLRVDAGGDLAKLIAERVAINARQAGIPVQIQARASVREDAASDGASAKSLESGTIRLVAWRYSSLSQRAELGDMISNLQLQTEMDEPTAENAEQTYEYERDLISEYRLIPLVVLPQYIGLSTRVRDWLPERWDAWRLADVWLDGKKDSTAPAGVQP